MTRRNGQRLSDHPACVADTDLCCVRAPSRGGGPLAPGANDPGGRLMLRSAVSTLCPEFPGAPAAVELVCGLSSAEAFEAAERGEVVLAGCMPALGEPELRWACPRCQRYFA